MKISEHGTSARLLLVALGLALATAAVAAEPITPDDVKGPIAWGSASNVTQLRHLYFSGQPDQAGLEAARAAGVEVVINLRAPSELDWDEPAAVRALGLEYHSVPVTGPAFDPAAFARIESLLAENEDRTIYLHCSSSNRVGGWLATHLVAKHGMDEEEALAVGRRAGITKPAVEERVHAYLEASSTADE
jgi:protein tyrosine phosphatase (PTP) superfamily phosphohydrolase (DUF442 family)